MSLIINQKTQLFKVSERMASNLSHRGAPQRRPRPTHFLAVPLHNHAALRANVAAFQNALLQSNPPIEGLDRSIVIDPRRLHFTLGVMALESSSTSPSNAKTLENALDLLRSIQPRLREIMHGERSLKVALTKLDIMKPEKKNGNVKANVLFTEPVVQGKDGARLLAVCNLVHQTFKDAGFVTETRPLKLHCTILNTSHRKSRQRMSFSYSDILAATGNGSSIEMDWGVWEVGEIHVWAMGSHGANNEYISCGRVGLS